MPPSATPADTAPEVMEMLYDRWRAMTLAERIELLERMHGDVESLAIAGIVVQHPDIDPAGIRHELLRRRYGDALADEVHQDARPR